MDFERITLGCGSREYQAASKLFHVTISESKAKILAVEKIKNDFLLERYNRYVYMYGQQWVVFLTAQKMEWRENDIRGHVVDDWQNFVSFRTIYAPFLA